MKTRQELDKILTAANLLLRGVLAQADLAVNTPVRDWTVDTRKRAMEALHLKAGKAAETLDDWMQQDVPIKNIARICGRLDEMKHTARMNSFSNSRTNGTANLRTDLATLREVFGDGCELEMSVQVEEIQQSPVVVQEALRPSKVKPSLVDPNERPYSVMDLAVLHNLSRESITKLYENEPGVLIMESSRAHQRKIGRRYRTIRVPRHVYLRVRRRMERK